MIVDIYTDGSHFKQKGRLGCGGVILVDGNLVDEFSLELTPAYLREIIHTSDVSNPTTEMMGVLQALRKFNIPKRATEINIYTDYEGVSCWLGGKWKINKPYIKILHDLIQEEIKEKGLKEKTKFLWVKGHQRKSVMDPKARWNNYVDKLAKGE
jgi:ribonuclease HI